MNIRNQGLDLERELLEQSEEDYILGAETNRGIASDIDYKKYLPIGERQNIGEEKMDCASRSPNEILETKFNYLTRNEIISQKNRDWLRENSYYTHYENRHEIKFSDAFIAIFSKTTRKGNSLKSPCQAIHRHGLIPKSMLPQVSTFNEYHNPARITKKMEDLGKEFLKRFSIRYVKDYGYKSKNEFLNTGGYAWGELVKGVYQRSENSFNHAFPYITRTTEARDSYPDRFDGDFIKKLAENYKLLPYAYRFIINEKRERKTTPKTRQITLLAFLKQLFLWRR